MSVLTRRVAGPAGSAGLAGRLAALDRVLALAPGRLDDDVAARAAGIVAKAGERLRLGSAHTVVALAGATGSGKSSLFNALAGQPLSQVGVLRPTTGAAHAAVHGAADAGPLLDWLGVPRRHLVAAGGGGPGAPDGLVLLDLPDVDSVEAANRLEAERLVERVDLLVWVLDPQKYADAALHDRYLVPLAGHAGVMLAVLNQVDRLPAVARDACLADLRRLLDDEGLGAVPAVAASAVTGQGLADLRAEIARRVAGRRASVLRLAADLDALAAALGDTCTGTAADGVGRAERGALVASLGEAAGVEVVADAVAAAHRRRGRAATGWPFTRWASRLRPDPARRLRLRDSPSELVRTSLPGPSAVQRARVDQALRRLGERAAHGLAEPWTSRVRQAATGRRAELPDLLDRAVAGTDLGLGRRPRWWRAANAVQLLLALVALAGLAWLAALFVVAWLQLPPPPLPALGRVPLPTLLLAGGLAAGIVLALLAVPPVRVGSRRRARAARRRLHARIERVAAAAVVVPVERELAAHRELCRAVDGVRGG